MPGINFSNAKYFDGPSSGFLVLGTSANTINQGSAIIHLTSVEFDFSNTATALQSFDSNFAVANALTSSEWTVQAEGYFTSSSENAYSGQSTYTTSASLNGEELLDLAIARRTDLKIVFRSGSKIKRGDVVITNYKLSSSVGEVQTYSISFAGNGVLTSIA